MRETIKTIVIYGVAILILVLASYFITLLEETN